MAQTRMNSSQINKSVWWADLIDSLWFYDETKNYNINDQVKRWLNVYRAKTVITWWAEWDYTNSPDLSSNWESIDSIAYTIHPSTQQALTTTKTDILFDTEDTTTPSFNLVANEIICLKQCTVFVALTMSADVSTGSTRSESRYNLQINTGTWYVDAPNSEIILYNRTTGAWWNTATIIKPFTLNVWDKIKVQGIITNWNNISTYPNWCSLSIRTPASWKWDKWDKWDTWAPWDITRQWTFISWTTVANLHEAYQFQWQSYVCLTNWTTTDPSIASPDWDLLAQKWIDWAGATINVNQNWTPLLNTPHETLNFKWDVSVVDTWSWIADITINKNFYMVPIRAEENAWLSANTYEWAFGNWAQTPIDWWVTIYIPTWYTASIVAMSLRLWSWTANVEAVVNWVLQWTNCNVSVSVWQWATNDAFTPIALANWDYVNFRTTTATWTSWPNVATMWIKYTQI